MRKSRKNAPLFRFEGFGTPGEARVVLEYVVMERLKDGSVRITPRGFDAHSEARATTVTVIGCDLPTGDLYFSPGKA